MKLSNKKIKHIKRHASTKTPDQLAGDLRISIKEVQKVLNSSGGISPESGTWLIEVLDRVFLWGLIAFSFLAPFMFLRHIRHFADLPKTAFIQIGVLFLFLVWLLRALMNKKCPVLKSPFNLPILAFILWSLISVIYAYNRYEGIVPWMQWAASALMFFLVSNGIREEKHRIQLMAAVFLSGFLCALLGIGQYLLGVSWVPQVISPAATFGNKNMAVHFIVLTFPLGVGFFLNNDRRARDWTLGIASVLMILFLIYSGTRAGWLALTVEILFLLAFLARERIKTKDAPFWNRNKGLAAGAGLVIILIMINLGPHGFRWGADMVDRAANVTTDITEQTQNQTGAESSIVWRMRAWRNTLEMIRDNFWVGLGLGNHKVFYPLYHRKAVVEKTFSEAVTLRNVHNDYLQAFTELGVVGILLLGWAGLVFVKVASGLTSPGQSRKIRFCSIAITASIIGLLVNAFFSFPFQRAVPPFCLMILTGILASWYAGDKSQYYDIRSRGIIAGVLFIALIGLAFLIRFQYLNIQSDRHFLRLTRSVQHKNWARAIAEGKKAFQYNPRRTRILSNMAQAYIETGKNREAIAVLETVIADYPNSMNDLFNLGLAYANIGDHKRAIRVYEKVLLIKPDDTKAHNNMGSIYMGLKNRDKALEAFKKAVEFDPKNSLAYANIGTVSIHKGQHLEAARAFERAVELNPGWAMAQKNLGFVYFKYLNRKKEGLDHLREALKLDPDVQDAASIRKLIERIEKTGQ